MITIGSRVRVYVIPHAWTTVGRQWQVVDMANNVVGAYGRCCRTYGLQCHCHMYPNQCIEGAGTIVMHGGGADTDATL